MPSERRPKMTVIYCDLCGVSLKGGAGVRIAISEYKAESCDDCAKRLIKYVKESPWHITSQYNNLLKAASGEVTECPQPKP